jgi:hypothetical protein
MSRNGKEEFELQRKVVQILMRACLPKILWWHTPNGEKRDPVVGAKLKMMGTKPGVPDFTFILPTGRAAFLELKSATGQQDAPQIAWERDCDEMGVPYHIACAMGIIREVSVA